MYICIYMYICIICICKYIYICKYLYINTHCLKIFDYRRIMYICIWNDVERPYLHRTIGPDPWPRCSPCGEAFPAPEREGYVKGSDSQCIYIYIYIYHIVVIITITIIDIIILLVLFSFLLWRVATALSK